VWHIQKHGNYYSGISGSTKNQYYDSWTAADGGKSPTWLVSHEIILAVKNPPYAMRPFCQNPLTTCYYHSVGERSSRTCEAAHRNGLMVILPSLLYA